MSSDQHAILDHPAKTLWIGTGTKTGKTVALAQWLIEGLALGERCAWVGPWHKRTRTGFEHISGAFAEAKRNGMVRVRENDMRLEVPSNGGALECFSGDNPDSIFGEGFDRVAVDEAGRQPAGVLPAVMSTVTATGGRVRLAFNLDRGRRHWAIAGLLEARSGCDRSNGWITLKTSESPYVKAEDIETARRRLPKAVFAALYDAEIQDDDASVFQNIERCHAGSLEEPREGAVYVIGADLAKTRDWTVLTVMDVRRRHVVAFERFHGAPWTVQRQRIADLAKRYNRARVFVDATGVGDPNVEELGRAGVSVMSIQITSGHDETEVRDANKTLRGLRIPKSALIEDLIVAIENVRLTYPAELELLTNELKVFEFDVRPSGYVAYSAPDGQNDDAVISLALANRGLGSAPVQLSEKNVSSGGRPVYADDVDSQPGPGDKAPAEGSWEELYS